MKRMSFYNADPESLVNVGTKSQESVISAAGVCAFYSSSDQSNKGFFVTNGGRPIPISHSRNKNIKKWVDAIPVAYDDDVSGWGNNTHFYWSIGDVTVDGIDYTNVVVRWSIITGEWAVYSYPTEFRFLAGYVDSGGNNTIVGGDDDGNVIQIQKPATYTDYSSTVINWEVRTHEEDFEYSQVKELTENIVMCSRDAYGATVGVKINGGDEITLGAVRGDITEIKLNTPLKGNYFQFIIKGNQVGGRATIKRLEIPNIILTSEY